MKCPIAAKGISTAPDIKQKRQQVQDVKIEGTGICQFLFCFLFFFVGGVKGIWLMYKYRARGKEIGIAKNLVAKCWVGAHDEL